MRYCIFLHFLNHLSPFRRGEGQGEGMIQNTQDYASVNRRQKKRGFRCNFANEPRLVLSEKNSRYT